MDFFQGTLQAGATTAGSLVLMRNVYRLKGACTTPASAVENFKGTPHSKFVGRASVSTEPIVVDASLQVKRALPSLQSSRQQRDLHTPIDLQALCCSDV